MLVSVFYRHLRKHKKQDTDRCQSQVADYGIMPGEKASM